MTGEMSTGDRQSWWTRHPLATLGIGLAIGALVMVAWYCFAWLHFPHAISDRGAFGDSFGPAVGLISSLALGAAVLSVMMQREELALTREEMAKHRQAAEAQAKSAERHANALEAQAGAAERHASALEAQAAAADRHAAALEASAVAQARANKLTEEANFLMIEHGRESMRASKAAEQALARANSLAAEANELAEEHIEQSEDAQMLAMRGHVQTALLELQRWDEIGVEKTSPALWSRLLSGGNVDGRRELAWLVEQRREAEDRLNGLVAELDKIIRQSASDA